MARRLGRTWRVWGNSWREGVGERKWAGGEAGVAAGDGKALVVSW